MKIRLLTLIAVALLALNVTPEAAAQQNKGEHVIADFEGEKPVGANNTTHKAKVTAVRDAPEGGGRVAAKTVVDAAAGATGHFGTGFSFPALDLSGAGEIQFWIKTDIESKFNFQVHSDDNKRASVFQFSTDGSEPGKWKQITASVASFTVPQWSKGKVDLASVNKIQVTAFGSGPYDGKYIIFDHVVSSDKRRQPASAKPKAAAKTDGPVQRGGPINLKRTESNSAPKSPPKGFRSLFDGRTLNGWTAHARIPVPNYPGAEFRWQLKGDALVQAKKNVGRWTIEDGAIVGGQEPPGSG